jgi:hypothetical protein
MKDSESTTTEEKREKENREDRGERDCVKIEV